MIQQVTTFNLTVCGEDVAVSHTVGDPMITLTVGESEVMITMDEVKMIEELASMVRRLADPNHARW